MRNAQYVAHVHEAWFKNVYTSGTKLSKARSRPTCNPNNNKKHMSTYALAPDSLSSQWCKELKHGCASLTLHSANRCRCILALSRYIKWAHNKMCCTQSYPHITTFPSTVDTPAITVCGVCLLSLPQTAAAPATAHRLCSNTIPQHERIYLVEDNVTGLHMPRLQSATCYLCKLTLLRTGVTEKVCRLRWTCRGWKWWLRSAHSAQVLSIHLPKL